MVRVLVTAFLISHGLVHLGVYLTPKDAAQRVPPDPTHSWALAACHITDPSMHVASLALAAVTAGLYTAAGLAVALGLSIWIGLAALAAGTAIVLKGLWFNVWLSFGMALDLAVLVALANDWPGSLL